MFDSLGDRVAVGQMMNCIGLSLSSIGRNIEAREQLHKAVAYHADMEQPRLEAHALAGLDGSYWMTGEYDEAAAWYERSLLKRRSIADLRGEGWMLQRLARAGVAAGRTAEAETLLSRASEISVDCSDEELLEKCARLRHALEASSQRLPRVAYKGPNGLWSRSEHPSISWSDLQPVAVEVNGDVAFIYYSVTWTVPSKSGQPVSHPSRRFYVFQKRDRRWLMAGGSVAPVPR